LVFFFFFFLFIYNYYIYFIFENKLTLEAYTLGKIYINNNNINIKEIEELIINYDKGKTLAPFLFATNIPNANINKLFNSVAEDPSKDTNLQNIISFASLKLGEEYNKKIENIDDSSNILDKWIINKTNILLNIIIDKLDKYQVNIISDIIDYINQLSNWYMKMSKIRLRGLLTVLEWKYSLQTLLFVINKFIIIVAPVIPFITETIYQMLKK
jgi:isoleucyl-tRNA synthetase